MYSKWIDAEEKSHLISKMSKKYIENCINRIKNSPYFDCSEEIANADSGNQIFGPKWCYEHGKGYLEAFYRELEIRKRIKKKDYLSVTVDEICDNCSNCLKCENSGEHNEGCVDWEFELFEIFRLLKNEDLEVAKRSSVICNDIEYQLNDDED